MPIASTISMFQGHDQGASSRAPGLSVTPTPLIRTLAGVLEDAVWLLLLALLFPLGILLIGTPIVLCVQAVVEIARRL